MGQTVWEAVLRAERARPLSYFGLGHEDIGANQPRVYTKMKPPELVGNVQDVCGGFVFGADLW